MMTPDDLRMCWEDFILVYNELKKQGYTIRIRFKELDDIPELFYHLNPDNSKLDISKTEYF